METSAPPHPAVDLSYLYCDLVYTPTDLLPPPLDDTPEALHARNHAAIAKVAALLPVNADELDLAAQCIAARGQAEEMLRLLRQHAGNIGLVMRLNAQYGSMVRTSLSVHERLMRVQAFRRKRQANASAANEDASALHIAEQSMLGWSIERPKRWRQDRPNRSWRWRRPKGGAGYGASRGDGGLCRPKHRGKRLKNRGKFSVRGV